MDLAPLPRGNGFRLRGQQVTRLETFDAVAFAFASGLFVMTGGFVPADRVIDESVDLQAAFIIRGLGFGMMALTLLLLGRVAEMNSPLVAGLPKFACMLPGLAIPLYTTRMHRSRHRLLADEAG